MADEIEIVVADVNDIEAHVIARYRGEHVDVALMGTIRGPYCATAKTLPAEYAFHEIRESESAAAEAIVPDPCTWSEEVPHLYEVNVVARRGADVVSEYRGAVGLRSKGGKSWE